MATVTLLLNTCYLWQKYAQRHWKRKCGVWIKEKQTPRQSTMHLTDGPVPSWQDATSKTPAGRGKKDSVFTLIILGAQTQTKLMVKVSQLLNLLCAHVDHIIITVLLLLFTFKFQNDNKWPWHTDNLCLFIQLQILMLLLLQMLLHPLSQEH